MELLYKSDWEQTMQNYIAWWNREDFGRCGLSVTAKKAGTNHMQPPLFLPGWKTAGWITHI